MIERLASLLTVIAVIAVVLHAALMPFYQHLETTIHAVA